MRGHASSVRRERSSGILTCGSRATAFSTLTPVACARALPPNAGTSFRDAAGAETGWKRWSKEVGCSMNSTSHPRRANARARCDDPSLISASNRCAEAKMIFRDFKCARPSLSNGPSIVRATASPVAGRRQAVNLFGCAAFHTFNGECCVSASAGGPKPGKLLPSMLPYAKQPPDPPPGARSANPRSHPTDESRHGVSS